MYTLYFLNLHVKKFLYVYWVTPTVQTMERQNPSPLKKREKGKIKVSTIGAILYK